MSERRSIGDLIHNPPTPTHDLTADVSDGIVRCRWCGRDAEQIKLLELAQQTGFQCPKAPSAE